MKKEIKLKPCPFCGSEAELFEGYSLSHVYCINCNAQTDSLKSAQRAVELWNNRLILDALERENSFLHEYTAKLEKELKRFKKYSASQQEVKTLREALKKYAKGKNYIGVSSDGELFEFKDNAYGLDEMEIGFAARKALKGGEKC